MQLVDSHCHINFPELAEQLPALLDRAARNQVTHMLCVAVNFEDLPQIEAIAAEYPHIFASVGLHPTYTDCHEPDTEELISRAQAPKVVAIGETGLDYFRASGPLDWQRARFARHIAAAVALDKPLIIHTRAAREDTIAMLRSEGAERCGGVMHCFTEDWTMAKQALDLGFYISFSGIVTFKNAEELREVARKTPADRMLVETDAPYLAPVPNRGKTNEPAFVRHTAEFLAELRGVDVTELAAVTTENFFRLFRAATRVVTQGSPG